MSFSLDSLHPVIQTVIATGFTWGLTAAGAALVFFFRAANQKLMDLLMGFGAGVMIAASFWSLLCPAIEICEQTGGSSWLIPSLGFAVGGLFIVLADKVLEKSRFFQARAGENGASVKRCLLLILAVTLHNIPEGLAVGVAFGSAGLHLPGASFAAAAVLATGIGLQNFPEGASVSLPLRREGMSRRKSFFYGQASGIVEPLAGLLGVVAAITMKGILPFMLSFAAGAMISVVTAELIPESTDKSKNLATVGVVVGFLIMMVLDVALG